MKLEINPSGRHNLIDGKMKTKKKSVNKEKTANLSIIILIFILLSLALASSATAAPQIHLINQTDPVEYGEIQKIMLNIIANNTNETTNSTVNITITQALIEFDQQNHTLEQGTGHYTYTWIPQQKGINTYKIYATDSSNQTQKYTSSFQVTDTSPPIIIETQPKGTINYNLVEIRVTTNKNSTCKYDQANISYDSMYYSLSDQGVNHTQLRSFGDGEVMLFAKCKDASNNIGQSQAISFKIDTLPPIVTEITPTGTVNQAEISLRVSTDELSTCRFGKIHQAYDSLESQFQTTGATLHEQPLKLSQGINTYYIECQDRAGNKNEIIVLNLELNLPPTASISIERNNTYSALSQGTHYLSLTTSKSLSQAPTLKLRIGNRLTNIPLEGSSQSWDGYFIIPSDTGDDVGEFQFEGIDTKGTVGTEITSGKLILIDTTIPLTPTSLKLANENNKIKLTWEYDGEDIDHYNIYRSTAGNTDKANFKTIAIGKTYLDSDVTNKIGYFYRISAVDKAGNEGLLSDEEFLMTEFQNITSQFKQDPEILAIINSKISELEAVVQDIDVKISRLEETTDQDILEIVNQEGLVTKQKEIKSKIQTIIGELKTYKETKLTKEEVNAKIAIINTKVDEYYKGIIKEVKLINKVQKEQAPEEGVVQESINEYLKDKILSDDKKETYNKKTKALQEEARIQQELASYEITYEYKESDKVMLIREAIISSKDLEGVVAQEIIPKDALKVSEITFDTPPANLNRLGAQWTLTNLNNLEITYKIHEEKDLNQLQVIRTVLLYDFEFFLSNLSDSQLNESSQVTGKAVSENKQGFSITKIILIPLGILIIIILLTYYFVFLRTDKMYEKDVMMEMDRQEEKVINSINLPNKPINASSALQIGTKTNSNQNIAIIHSQIQQAYYELEQGNLDSAYETYSQALSLYLSSKLNLKDRLRANFEMNTLRDHLIKAKKPKDLYT